MNRKIWIDVETLGLNPEKYPLIQIAAICEDKVFNGECLWNSETKAEFTAILIHGRTYKLGSVPGGAPEDLAISFFNFIKNCQQGLSKYEKLIPCGHNINFDLQHLEHFYRGLGYDNFLGCLDYHHIDTMVIANFLKDKGKLDQKQRTSLGDLCMRFGIPMENQHDALCDITATKALYEKLKTYV